MSTVSQTTVGSTASLRPRLRSVGKPPSLARPRSAAFLGARPLKNTGRTYQPLGLERVHPVLSSASGEAESYTRDISSTPRLIQHKNEAKTFYRFLSIVYDKIVNPGHWTIDMRDDALVPALLDDPSYKVKNVT